MFFYSPKLCSPYTSWTFIKSFRVLGGWWADLVYPQTQSLKKLFLRYTHCWLPGTCILSKFSMYFFYSFFFLSNAAALVCLNYNRTPTGHINSHRSYVSYVSHLHNGRTSQSVQQYQHCWRWVRICAVFAGGDCVFWERTGSTAGQWIFDDSATSSQRPSRWSSDLQTLRAR